MLRQRIKQQQTRLQMEPDGHYGHKALFLIYKMSEDDQNFQTAKQIFLIKISHMSLHLIYIIKLFAHISCKFKILVKFGGSDPKN